MKYDPEKHHRRSIRLKEYDYRLAGAYFVTTVAQDRECLFGDIANGEMQPNDAGQMVERWWKELRHKYPDILLDEYVVMPNHFHGIIGITVRMVPRANSPNSETTVGADLCVCPQTTASLNAMVQWFKTMSTNEYIQGVKQLGWRPFNRRLWQRNYYEHVIRNEQALDSIRDYIAQNPLMWMEDAENPVNNG